jgi:HK97 gp10 family phage protein
VKTSMKIEGLKELDAALSELPKATAKNNMRRAAETALQPVVDHAKSLAPAGKPRKVGKRYVTGGDLKRSLTVSRKLGKSAAKKMREEQRREGKYSINVYAGASPMRYAHLVEFGTKPRYHKKTGKFVGQMPARPFMRPAWDANKTQVLATFQKDMWARIEKSAKRLARKAAKSAKSAEG